MKNYHTSDDEQDLLEGTHIEVRSSSTIYIENFPISDSEEEQISIEDFEKLTGTCFIEFLRAQDDMI